MDSKIKANLLEKVLVNWAAIPDTVFYSIRSSVKKDRFHNQSFKDRLITVGNSRIKKYEQLLNMKKQYGFIPKRAKNTHLHSPCAITRLAMVKYRRV